MPSHDDPVYYVYEHWRPDRDECFYVGKGKGKRANEMRIGRNRHHLAIQAKISRQGMCVEVRLFRDSLTNDQALALEIERIAFWRALHIDLANISPGGDGGLGHKQSPESIEKTAAAHRGMKRSAETRAKISAAAKARPLRPDAVEIMAQANRGKKRSPFSAEHLARLSAANKGRKMLPQVAAALLAANLGRRFNHTPEAKAKMSASRKGKPGHVPSGEHKAKISAANKGKVFSQEHRDRISAAAKARYQKIREQS